MTHDEYGMILNRLWTVRSYMKDEPNHKCCDRLLFNWLWLGMSVFGWVKLRPHMFSSRVFYFDKQRWKFTLNGNLCEYSDVVENGTWTPELVEKIKKHYDLGRSAGLTIEDTQHALELLGTDSHPIPKSDEDMLQQILKGKDDD